MYNHPKDTSFPSKIWSIVCLAFVVFSAKQVFETDKIAEKIQAATLALAALGLIAKSEKTAQDLNYSLTAQTVNFFVMAERYDQQYLVSWPMPISSFPAIPFPALPLTNSPVANLSTQQEARDIYESARQEIAQHLARAETQYQLKALTKEACNYALEEGVDKLAIESGSDDSEAKVRFYNEVYLYLRVWLKNSLKYGVEMPLLDASILPQAPFAKAIKFLRDTRTGYFLTDMKPTYSYQLLTAVVRQYLDTLLNKIENLNTPIAAGQ